MGAAVPAANNAILNLAPQTAASIAGLRGMFRQAGSITSVSVITAVLARSEDPGIALARAFLVLAALLVAVLPAILRVPEHRGSW